MREIARLRRQQEAEQITPENPALISELRALRQRKGELEGHLGALQDSRRQLMEQLEGLMRMLKSQQTSSPRSTPNSSPRSGKSPPMPGGSHSIVGSGGGACLTALGTSPIGSIHTQSSAHTLMGTSNVLRVQQNTPITQGSFNPNQMEHVSPQVGGDVRGPFSANGAGSE